MSRIRGVNHEMAHEGLAFVLHTHRMPSVDASTSADHASQQHSHAVSWTARRPAIVGGRTARQLAANAAPPTTTNADGLARSPLGPRRRRRAAHHKGRGVVPHRHGQGPTPDGPRTTLSRRVFVDPYAGVLAPLVVGVPAAAFILRRQGRAGGARGGTRTHRSVFSGGSDSMSGERPVLARPRAD